MVTNLYIMQLPCQLHETYTEDTHAECLVRTMRRGHVDFLT